MNGFGCFGSLLGLTFLGRKAFPFLHHLLPLLIPLLLLIGRVRLGSLSRGRGERLGLDFFFEHVTSSVRLQQIQET